LRLKTHAIQPKRLKMAIDRDELRSRAYKEQKARILTENDVCHVCGCPDADSIDHLIPVSRGGARYDPANLAPIHHKPCPHCGKTCNRDKSDKTPEEIARPNNSVHWFLDERL
jgi:5-methylcytosine-specific restriction endonuclease McrA